jgi:hypothetical protein
MTALDAILSSLPILKRLRETMSGAQLLSTSELDVPPIDLSRWANMGLTIATNPASQGACLMQATIFEDREHHETFVIESKSKTKG